MKRLTAIPITALLALSAQALPTYDNFSSYGSAGTWTEVAGPPIVSYTTNAPLLGGTTAPSGEAWLTYTNAPVVDLYSNYYAGYVAGSAAQNVAIVNYFASGQPGNTDTVGFSVPGTLFPGPFVVGNDTSGFSVWTPGWSQTGETTPALVNYLGGIGACLEFADDIPAVTGSKVFVSFFVDIPDCTGSFGAGQSLDHGYSAGFINAAELPNTDANQYGLPGYSAAGYASIPLMAKFNVRDNNTTSWKPGTGYYDGNGNSAGAVNQKTIHFIVMSYEFNGGAGLDKIGIQVDPANSTFGATTEPASFSTSSSPTTGLNLPDVGGFFFLANTQDGGATPNSGVFFNSLSIGTNWAYVTGGPEFASYAPDGITNGSGQTVVLDSSAVAITPVAVTETWGVTNGSTSGNLTPGGRFNVGATGILTIANLQAGDAGTYSLQPTTAITDGTAPGNNYPTSSPPTVIVVDPVISPEPANVTAPAGASATFSLTAATGNGPLFYQWYKGNAELTDGPTGTGSTITNSATSTLTILNTSAADDAVYTCYVTNSAVPATVAISTGATLITPTPPTFTAENGSGLGSSQFQLTFTGPVGSSYRVWRTTNVALTPVTNTWTPIATNTFTSGANTYTDTAATGASQFYTITVP